jgi:hypothetical protein
MAKLRLLRRTILSLQPAASSLRCSTYCGEYVSAARSSGAGFASVSFVSRRRTFATGC